MHYSALRFSLIILLSGYAATVAAQTVSSTTTPTDEAVRDNQITDRIRAYNALGEYIRFDNRDRRIKGSPFLFRGWKKADLRLVDNKQLADVPIKYNIYRRELRALRPQGDSIIVSRMQVLSFVLHDMTIQGPKDRLFRRFIDLDAPEFSAEYFEVLAEKEGVQLLKLEYKSYQAGNTAGTYGTTMQGPSYADERNYFLRVGTSPVLQPVRMNGKSLSKVLPTWKPALDSYGKSIRNEGEMVAFFQKAP